MRKNVRNTRKQAARTEAFSLVKWKRGDWHEWVGTYTIIKPHGAAIFQAKNNENDWSVQLNMNGNGNILLNHRRGKDVTIAKNMVGTRSTSGCGTTATTMRSIWMGK